jgi:uncharacterized membrane protein
MEYKKYPQENHAAYNSSVSNLNELEEQILSKGQKLADKVVLALGSWGFIGFQTVILTLWTVLNIGAWLEHWDPYPFILLNLFLSMQAAYTAPIIMMSQNKQAVRDRLEAHHDFLINKKAEKEIRLVLEELAFQRKQIAEMRDLIRQLKSKNEL